MFDINAHMMFSKCTGYQGDAAASGEACQAACEDDCECFSELASVGQPDIEHSDSGVWPDAAGEMPWMLLGDGAGNCLHPNMLRDPQCFSVQEQEALLHAELQAHRQEHFHQMQVMETYMHNLAMASPEPQSVMWCEQDVYSCTEEILPLQPGIPQKSGCTGTVVELMEEE